MAWDWDKLQQQKKVKSMTTPPPVNEMFDKFKNFKGGVPGIWLIIFFIIALILTVSAFYTVDVNEKGVIQRFGKHVRTTGPGLHMKWPMPIEKVTKVKVDFVYKEEFGLRTVQADVRTQYAEERIYLDESLMLTGDLNVVVVPWIVQYRVEDPYKYLFKVRDQKRTLRDLSEAAMCQVVGDRSLDEVISKREEIANEAKVLLQAELDLSGTGIKVNTIEMKKTNVPEPVQASFNEVNQSIQEKEKMVYEAREGYNKRIPQAQGEAEKTIKQAEGYALDRINTAKGDAARFLSLYQEYAKAKDVTRRRLYLEAVRDVFPKLGPKYIVDEKQKNFLPLLNIGQPLKKEGE
ncbi:MAG: FtsH protease activity modulator HflK [Desulfobacteraceae bacterium]|nr:MAG: FtsH protease activity modulator HflK [Desulfobacteraceae bacterium]